MAALLKLDLPLEHSAFRSLIVIIGTNRGYMSLPRPALPFAYAVPFAITDHLRFDAGAGPPAGTACIAEHAGPSPSGHARAVSSEFGHRDDGVSSG